MIALDGSTRRRWAAWPPRITTAPLPLRPWAHPRAGRDPGDADSECAAGDAVPPWGDVDQRQGRQGVRRDLGCPEVLETGFPPACAGRGRGPWSIVAAVRSLLHLAHGPQPWKGCCQS